MSATGYCMWMAKCAVDSERQKSEHEQRDEAETRNRSFTNVILAFTCVLDGHHEDCHVRLADARGTPNDRAHRELRDEGGWKEA